MPTNYDYIQQWLDDMFNPNYDPFAELERIAKKCGIEVDNKKQTITVKNPVSPFEIQSVLSNRKKNAFTVVWTDGTHTTVHCQSGDDWDDEKALAMCFTKKALGNKGNFNDKFNDALNNKMKVIPAEPAPEKACDCDGTCIECKCKEESVVDKALAKEFVKMSLEKVNTFGVNTQTATEFSKAANKASNSLKEMIEALAGESDEEKPKPQHVYKVYTRIGGESFFDGSYFSIESLRERVHKIAEELYGEKPYYYRTWMNGDRMTIDFGHYTQFIEVEGITPDEYAKH